MSAVRDNMNVSDLRLGVDVGSTTVKAVVANVRTGTTLFSSYRRHHAHIAETCDALLEEAFAWAGNQPIRTAVCGSAGKPVAEALGVHYVQEVVANTVAVRRLYPQVRCAIELGGQDAKVVFFRKDETTGKVEASDMRMNGSCAGGTGAFIDEIAKLLDTEDAGLEALAAQGTHVYDISGRCGVFAKTDIQPLLIQGVSREDIALSTFHAIAKQTIGGLSQGLELAPPIIFEGGPLTYNPTLIRVFAERLNLKPNDIVVPDHPETIVALGTALSIDELFDMSDAASAPLDPAHASTVLDELEHAGYGHDDAAAPLFSSQAELDAFRARHAREAGTLATPPDGAALRVYVGIDSGSTTSKVAFVGEDGSVIDAYYTHNDGDPINAVRRGLLTLEKRAHDRHQTIEVLGCATTGYGETMLARAVGADTSCVETVAHARGSASFAPDATFILDIGGQDMKAIWLRDGIITNIVLNEACSSGCGSFLENFADTLDIPVEDIAEVAFSSKNPARLGSRCTVFMTSTVINEQRNGKLPADLMAGLCRSIIENVFTKVVRLSNTEGLGEHVVVQGGTFRNDAVLRALEEYLDRDVVRAPFPGEMGAIGAALYARDTIARKGYANGHSTSFIGFDGVRALTFDQEAGVACTGCSNGCVRTITRFSTGALFVTGNHCERGAHVEGARDITPAALPEKPAPDLFVMREKLLFKTYPATAVRKKQDEVIGLPRTLEFWDSMPFWTTFLHALGYETRLSHKSSHELLESGLRYVASDTVCLPAKLVHGHVLDLCKQGVDRILLPHIMHLPPEGTDKMSPYTCAIVMGYPMVVRNFQDPEQSFDVRFDTPVFHWFNEKNRHDQICNWARKELNATASEAEQAFKQAEAAILSFRSTLAEEGGKILDHIHDTGQTAVVVAGRPYHTDPFVSHEISKRFSSAGIPVLTADSLPGQHEIPLENLVCEVTNDFHTRMLESALYAANDPQLEYVQIVSFGCGHDAILTDELTRILSEVGKKYPLVLKVDESDAQGSLNIRIKSFIETLELRDHAQAAWENGTFDPAHAELPPNPYPIPFTKDDMKKRTVLVPNISAEISTMLAAAATAGGYTAKRLPVGGIEQIKLGKRYTHNDICFPCQMVIGEAIDELQKGNYNHDEVAVAMVKFKCDCRLSHYAALLRRGLDRAGFEDVPIITTDPVDTKGMHPGVLILNAGTVVEAMWAGMMNDILQDLKRKTMPYEIHPGETQAVLDSCIAEIAEGISHNLRQGVSAFRRAIKRMAAIPYDRSHPKPRVYVTGELLVTYHPGSNFDIENYLVGAGMEVGFPRMTDQLRKDFIASMSEIWDFKADMTKESFLITALFNRAQKTMERIASSHPLYEHDVPPAELYKGVEDIIPKTLSCGEGWLMAAEIAHFAEEGVKSFIILQPFGCLPNHVCGRGVTKKLKDRYPDIQILPLDLDPDTSFANVENRLQMLIMGSSADSQVVQESASDEEKNAPVEEAPASDDDDAERTDVKDTDESKEKPARKSNAA